VLEGDESNLFELDMLHIPPWGRMFIGQQGKLGLRQQAAGSGPERPERSTSSAIQDALCLLGFLIEPNWAMRKMKMVGWSYFICHLHQAEAMALCTMR
jgi:hypothetical protein